MTRVAHSVNSVSTLRRPVITTEAKVPTNVRQKYLDTITDECLKIYPNNLAAAYKRAEDEEKVCCDKSKSRSIYLHSVVSCIKKLRNEATTDKVPQVPKTITPNMLTTHLQTLVGKAGTRGSWSIEYNEKAVPELTNKVLYTIMKRYVLTEEQLEIHGYPSHATLKKAVEEAKFDQVSFLQIC